MSACSFTRLAASGIVCLLLVGCRNPPGKPRVDVVALRPDQVLDFPTLYKQNCAACHGDRGRQGAALSLANPIYLATAGLDNLEQAIANGTPGTLMPAFAKSRGGLLTDSQVKVLSAGMMQTWGSSSTGPATLPYASHTAGNLESGNVAYVTFCASCHGADGTGSGKLGSIVDPAYLGLISDQALRSTIVAGKPDQGMPDWRSDSAGRVMTDQEATDIVAWLASLRIPAETPTAFEPQRRTTHE
jgi:mono/diheme cytochrome c family protein